MNKEDVEKKISFFGKELKDKILAHAQVKVIPPKTEILKESQQVHFIPLVIDGLIKVYARFDDRELLLYYIQPLESCIMSFSASQHNHPSKVFAITEVDTTVVLLPSDKLFFWMMAHPVLHTIFYKEYDKRYSDLLSTLQQLLFNRMEDRVLDYLVQRSKALQVNKMEFSPTKIAKELGTAREVVSRVARKLEADGYCKIEKNQIFLRDRD